MKRSKILEQYPWLLDFLSTRQIDELSVVFSCEYDRKRLERTNFTGLVTFCGNDSSDYARVFLVNKDGKVVKRVGTTLHVRKPKRLWRWNSETYTTFDKDETYGEAMRSVEGKEKVAFILDVNSQILYVL